MPYYDNYKLDAEWGDIPSNWCVSHFFFFCSRVVTNLRTHAKYIHHKECVPTSHARILSRIWRWRIYWRKKAVCVSFTIFYIKRNCENWKPSGNQIWAKSRHPHIVVFCVYTAPRRLCLYSFVYNTQHLIYIYFLCDVVMSFVRALALNIARTCAFITPFIDVARTQDFTIIMHIIVFTLLTMRSNSRWTQTCFFY